MYPECVIYLYIPTYGRVLCVPWPSAFVGFISRHWPQCCFFSCEISNRFRLRARHICLDHKVASPHPTPFLYAGYAEWYAG